MTRIPKVNELVERYREKTGEEPTQSTSLAGYAQMQVIREAVEKTGSTDGKAARRHTSRRSRTSRRFSVRLTYTRGRPLSRSTGRCG